MFGKVIINHQDIPVLLIHEIFAHSATGIRGYVQQWSRFTGIGYYHRSILHGTRFLQLLNNTRHCGSLLPYGHVDAEHIFFLLVDNCVHGNSRFSSLTVTDDQLPLSPADGEHGINNLDTCLQRSIYRLALDHPRSEKLYRPEFFSLDRTFAVQRLAHRAHHTTNEGFPYRHLHDAAGPFYFVSFFNVLVRT